VSSTPDFNTSEIRLAMLLAMLQNQNHSHKGVLVIAPSVFPILTRRE
jgi:hypothetical protein